MLQRLLAHRHLQNMVLLFFILSQHGVAVAAAKADSAAKAPLKRSSPPSNRTLVLYSIEDSGDDQTLPNLHYFISTAVSSPAHPPGDIQYAFLAPASAAGGDVQLLPQLPEQQLLHQQQPAAAAAVSAKYVHDAKACQHGWGPFGWYLMQVEPRAVDTFDYFVFISSTMAGPFLPRYAQVRISLMRPSICTI